MIAQLEDHPWIRSPDKERRRAKSGGDGTASLTCCMAGHQHEIRIFWFLMLFPEKRRRRGGRRSFHATTEKERDAERDWVGVKNRAAALA